MLERILFINSRHTDYLEDLTFAGLSELLGDENVISCPTNYHYYFSRYRYPKNIGECRSAFQYLPDRLRLQKQLRRASFDAVVIGSVKRDTCEAFLHLHELLPPKIPLILIDGGDRPEIGGDAQRENFIPLFREIAQKRKFDLVFKREFVIGTQYDKNVFPFPFSFKPPNFRSQTMNKKYDVAFWAVESDPIRTQALALLEGKFDCERNGSISGQTFRKYRRQGASFLEELSAAKIAYNFRGVGWDTLRYWEIPGVSSFMIGGKPGIVIPDNFLHSEHVVFCRDDLSDLISLTEYYLREETEREEIARNARAHLARYHHYLARAEYFIETCRHALGNEGSKSRSIFL